MVRNFIKKEDGVIAIEAAMVLPVSSPLTF